MRVCAASSRLLGRRPLQPGPAWPGQREGPADVHCTVSTRVGRASAELRQGLSHARQVLHDDGRAGRPVRAGQRTTYRAQHATRNTPSCLVYRCGRAVSAEETSSCTWPTHGHHVTIPAGVPRHEGSTTLAPGGTWRLVCDGCDGPKAGLAGGHAMRWGVAYGHTGGRSLWASNSRCTHRMCGAC